MRKMLCILFFGLSALCAAAHSAPTGAGLAAKVNATASGGHSVTLQGCASTTPGVSFNFYRGSAPGLETSVALNASPSAACNFVDTTVVGNTTYYYVAKAYLATASPSLSGPSNEIMAAVPPDAQPNAPTGLTLGTVARNNAPLLWGPPASQNGYVVVAYEVLRGNRPTLPSPAIIAIVPSSTTAWTDGSCSKCYYAVRSMTIKTAKSFTLSPMSNIVGPS